MVSSICPDGVGVHLGGPDMRRLSQVPLLMRAEHCRRSSRVITMVAPQHPHANPQAPTASSNSASATVSASGQHVRWNP
ncbi:MAG: hypothetical protein AB7S70_03205 [Hyphomicrobium sp.]|uniref:hypothetical protein n=1 Tax=Hyphomicrobium sp. TaxID=82 RepID=UPI003D10A50F